MGKFQHSNCYFCCCWPRRSLDGHANEYLHYSCSARWQPSAITATWHVSTPSVQLWACGNDEAPSETRSRFHEWNINSCSGRCKSRGWEYVRIHTDEGEAAGIADDILIGLLVPDASLERRPGQVQAVTVSQLPGMALGKVFRSLVAPLGAPTGIRFSSVVLPPLLVQTPFFSLHASCRALWGFVNTRQSEANSDKEKPKDDKSQAFFVFNLFTPSYWGLAFLQLRAVFRWKQPPHASQKTLHPSHLSYIDVLQISS